MAKLFNVRQNKHALTVTSIGDDDQKPETVFYSYLIESFSYYTWVKSRIMSSSLSSLVPSQAINLDKINTFSFIVTFIHPIHNTPSFIHHIRLLSYIH